MATIIGDQKSFAVGIDIMKYEPWIWGKSCVWINNNQIGDFEDENILVPFVRSLMRIAVKYQELWIDELKGLTCKDMFLTIKPFFYNPDEFYDLTYEEQGKYIKFDVFLFQFGENFDDWITSAVVQKGICKFLWAHITKRDNDSNVTFGEIQCFDVPLKDIQEVYRQFCKLIPDRYWPTMIEKLE